jgi:hypothetical protein
MVCKKEGRGKEYILDVLFPSVSEVLDSKVCIAICVNLNHCDIASYLSSLYFIEALTFTGKTLTHSLDIIIG